MDMSVSAYEMDCIPKFLIASTTRTPLTAPGEYLLIPTIFSLDMDTCE